MATRILILFFIGAMLTAPEDLSSCGPFFPTTIFTPYLDPPDEAKFLAGQLGILQPKYRRIYLMAAYRYLTGAGLTAPDQQSLISPPSQPDYWMQHGTPAIQAWLAARTQIGAPPLDTVDPFKLLEKSYTAILNCGDDAFSNATATLIAHGSAGAPHDDLRAWVAAQDQVFSNCTAPTPYEPHPKPSGPFIPAPLPPQAAPWMRYDRAYQIAAAEFYSGDFDAASADFERIAADRSSPWHPIGHYLAARALIRKATLHDPAAAPAAFAELSKVIADPEAAKWHASARELDRFLRSITDPDSIVNELAHTVAIQRTDVAGAMNDYRILLDRYDHHAKQPPHTEDIMDWIATMHADPEGHALEKWRATRSLPWLAAAITYAAEPDPELMAAAAQVPETSPAYLTIAFHRLRLLPADEARPLIDTMLRRKFDLSTRNLFLAERMHLARGWDELLRDAPRTELGEQYDGGGQSPAKRPQMHLDDDGAHILDTQAPLSTLAAAAHNPSLPPNLQLVVARSVWVRAILAGDQRTALEMSPLLAKLAPFLKPYTDLYIAAPDEPTRAFAAAWLLLNNPGMRPHIEAGTGRETPIPSLDNLRDNWWCVIDVPRQGANAPLELLYQGADPAARFVTAVQHAEAEQQQKQLAAAQSAPTLMAERTVNWVRAHPDDPRAPQALHLAVRAVHFACGGDADTNRWAKAAFEILHARYPKTEAARKTLYWYGADSH